MNSFDRAGIQFEEHRIAGNTPGIELYLRNKRPRDMTRIAPETTIVMVHGATYSSGSLYDVPLGGVSFMDYLAAQGYDVFAVDVRGYGRSSRPAAMEGDPALARPLIGTDTGVADFSSAVAFVLATVTCRASTCSPCRGAARWPARSPPAIPARSSSSPCSHRNG